MDDLHYSDKKRHTPSAGGDKYLNADYFDENFSLKFRKGQGNAQSFQKKAAPHSADEHTDAFDDDGIIDDVDELFKAPVRQTDTVKRPAPNGRPVRRAPASNGTRVPACGAHNTLPGDPSRVPTGKRVQSGKKKKRKKSNAFKIIIAVLLVLIIGVGGVAAYFYNRIDNMLDEVNYDDTIIQDRYLPSDAPASEGVRNILLIGSDARADGSVKGQRADTMILFTIDTKNQQLKLTSFLRDSYVYIPCLGYKGKMNAAYSKDGAQGVIDTIEYNYGIDVHNYVSVNFEGFETIIDLLGGVTVDGVTEKEARFMNSQAKTDIKAGSNHMDGYEALWYCRIRKLDSDFYRTQRQRKVLSAVVEKASKTKPTELLSLIEKALPYVKTDMHSDEIMALGKSAVGYIGYEMHQQQIPANGTWRDGNVNGSYVIDFDISKNKELLIDFVYKKAVKEG